MEVKWLVEPEVFQNEEGRLVAALQKLGVHYVDIQFGKSYDEYVSIFKETDCVVVHGSFQLADVVRCLAKWKPGLYCNLNKLNCRYYYPRLGQYLLNSNYVMLPFGELNRRKEWLLSEIGNGSIFLRPASAAKIFTGKIVTQASWEKDIKMLGFYDVELEELVVAAPQADLQKEWRAVIVDSKVIAASHYKAGNDYTRTEEVPNGVIEYAQKVVDSTAYSPDSVWTMDIGEINSGWTALKDELKVIEVGSFSCAGLYGCDAEAVVQYVNDAALRDWGK